MTIRTLLSVAAMCAIYVLVGAQSATAGQSDRLVLTIGPGPTSVEQAASAKSAESIPRNRLADVTMVVAGPTVAKVAPTSVNDYGLQLTIDDETGGNEPREQRIVRVWSLRAQAGVPFFSVSWSELIKTHYFKSWSVHLKEGGNVSVQVCAVELHPTGNKRFENGREIAEMEWRPAGAPFVKTSFKVAPFDVPPPASEKILQAVETQTQKVVSDFPKLPQGDSDDLAGAYDYGVRKFIEANYKPDELKTWSYKDEEMKKFDSPLVFSRVQLEGDPACSFSDRSQGAGECKAQVTAHADGKVLIKHKPNYLQRQVGLEPKWEVVQFGIDCRWTAVFQYDEKTGALDTGTIDWYAAQCKP